MSRLKKCLFTIAVAFFALVVPFAITGCDKGNQLDLRVQNGYVQYTANGIDWADLVAVSEITGEQGPQGVAGKQVEFNVSTTHIQWRYVGNANWTDLLALEDINGDDGKDLSFVEYTITYDYVYSDMNHLFDNYKSTSNVKSTEWITAMPVPKSTTAGEFDGWYIKGTDKKIENYDFVGGNTTLEARWKALPSGIYSSSKYIDNWDFLTKNYLDVSNGVVACNSQFDGYLRSISNNGGLKLVIDDSITAIGDNAFCYTDGSISYPCYSLHEVFISESVTKIGSRAFEISGLENIVIPDSVTEIGSRAFADCENLQKVVLPNKLDNLSSQLFDGCTSLMEIDLPDSLTTIENEVFYDCILLKEIIIPASVTNIGERVFGGCIGLEYLSVEDGNTKYHSWSNNIIETSTKTLLYSASSIPPTDGSVTQIGNYAYFGNTELNWMTIGEYVESIGTSAFHGCENLKRIHISSSNIANSITSEESNGYLTSYAETIYVKSGLSVEKSTYLLENFTKQESSDQSGYDMYVKNP